jgi:nitrite reductase (NADH) small subunit
MPTVEAGRVEEFEPGKFRIVEARGHEIGVIRLEDGSFHAVRNYCPHKGAPICKGIVGGTWPPTAPGELAFERAGEVLVCPWHGYEYDLRTGVELYQPEPTKLRKFKTEVRDGVVFVTV